MALELDDDRQAGLAKTLEEAGRVLSAVRYGRAFRFATAHVVLNPDNPIATSSFASELQGDLGMVERTLLSLPRVWEEVGKHQVVVLASPSSVPELDLLAEECGYEGAEEITTMLLTDPLQLVDGEPGILVRPLPEEQEPELAPLIARAHDWSPSIGRKLQLVHGHRLDDPRHVAFGAWEAGELVGVATGFLFAAVGQVVEVAVARHARRQRLGRALASAVAVTLRQRGAQLVWTSVETRSSHEGFFSALGFEAAYDSVIFTTDVT